MLRILYHGKCQECTVFFALQQVLPELRDPEYMKPLFKRNGIEVMLVAF